MRRNYNLNATQTNYTPEERARGAWNPTPLDEGFFMTESVGAQWRNQIAASATLTVAAAAPNNTALGPVNLTTDPQAVVVNPLFDLPSKYLLVIWNGSDCSVTVTVNNGFTIGGSSKYIAAQGATGMSIPAGQGTQVLVNALGFGDVAPQVVGTTTAAATTGGTITVQLRFV